MNPSYIEGWKGVVHYSFVKHRRASVQLRPQSQRPTKDATQPSPNPETEFRVCGLGLCRLLRSLSKVSSSFGLKGSSARGFKSTHTEGLGLAAVGFGPLRYNLCL